MADNNGEVARNHGVSSGSAGFDGQGGGGAARRAEVRARLAAASKAVAEARPGPVSTRASMPAAPVRDREPVQAPPAHQAPAPAHEAPVGAYPPPPTYPPAAAYPPPPTYPPAAAYPPPVGPPASASGTAGRPWSIAGLVCGILAILVLPIVLGPLGIAFGFVGNSKGDRLGLWVGIGSIVTMIVGMVLAFLVVSSLDTAMVATP